MTQVEIAKILGVRQRFAKVVIVSAELAHLCSVAVANVDITCAQQEWTREHGLALPEIPWEEEPLAFRL